MDRNINYAGQVPLETDLLKTGQFAMVGLAKLCGALFGTTGAANGFGTTQTVVPSLAVLVAPGEFYSLQNLEGSAYSSLPADTAHQVVKQGILLDAVTLATPAPATAGFSINYLVQVAYQDIDTGSTVLPYYNASNPSVAYSGPANSGAAQPTTRAGRAVVTVKAGAAATTGTQTTPAPDSGQVGLYVVTVANGAGSVTNSNISAYASAPMIQPLLFTGANQSLAANGYQKLPGGLIFQWGSAAVPASGGTASSVAVTFPIAFPTAAFAISGAAIGVANSIAQGRPSFNAGSPTPTGFNAVLDALGFTVFDQTCLFSWTAIGK